MPGPIGSGVIGPAAANPVPACSQGSEAVYHVMAGP